MKSFKHKSGRFKSFRHEKPERSQQPKSGKKNSAPNFSTSRDRATSPLDSGLRYVVGIHSCREVLRVRPTRVKEIWHREGGDRDHDIQEILGLAKKFNSIRVLPKPSGFLDKISQSHQGVCVLVSESPELDLSGVEILETSPILLIALDEITDPHNVGAVLRTAWLLGAKGVLVPKHRSAALTPAVQKVASGGAEHVPLHICDNFHDELTSLKEKGFWIYGFAGKAAMELPMVKFNQKVVLVIGAEDKGIRRTTEDICDELISIPQLESGESGASYNASVAAALAMYEVYCQHKNP